MNYDRQSFSTEQSSLMEAMGWHLKRWKTNGAMAVAVVLFGACCGVYVSGQEISKTISTDLDHDNTTAIPLTLHSLLKRECYDCHGDNSPEGNLSLTQLSEQEFGEPQRQIWWKVLNNVRAGTMPPPDAGSEITDTERVELANWIKFDVFQINPADPDPGKVTIRRLNRTEYTNTIRDLMGIDFNADVVFPPDDTGFGFDNIGDALSLSPMLVEKYLAAATEIVDKAVPKVRRQIPAINLSGRDFENNSGWNLKFDRSGKNQVKIDRHGEYTVKIKLRTHGTFEFTPQRGDLVVKIDDSVVHTGNYGWDESKVHWLEFPRDWQEGEHSIEFVLTTVPLADGQEIPNNFSASLSIDSVIVEGPSDRSAWNVPNNYRRFFPLDDPPSDPKERHAYIVRVLDDFTTKAFRRPADTATLDKLVSIAERLMDPSGENFEQAVAQAMVPVLASSRFLFKTEGIELSQTDSSYYARLDEYALASRLSYFLWSSMPDEELFRLASRQELRANLAQQFERMLRDPKSKALVTNFVGQWLRTRDVEKVSIDALAALGLQKEFDELRSSFFGRRRPRSDSERNAEDPETKQRRERFQEIVAKRDMLDGKLKTSMKQETEMLFAHIVKENRSIREIVDPGYTFLNQKLVEYYGLGDLPGMSDIRGEEMRRVELPADSWRGGVLTQGSMHLITSNPTRTSPVKRGLFVLENLLGTPTPPAPPNVPELEDSANRFGDREPSLRELLAVHRESALCASCHARMDPLGLALENYNALAMFRTVEAEQPIDSAGQLVTGEEFQDVRDLRRIIANERRHDLYRCLTEKMLVYALGRGLDYSDEHIIDEIVAKLDENDGAIHVLLKSIVESNAFQRQRVAKPKTLTSRSGDLP
ncbi:DUF1592 domain-containing protein [Pirellulaceae bacterium SH449]